MFKKILLLFLLNSLNCYPVTAGDLFLLAPGYVTRSTIDGGISNPNKNSSGVLTVNVASGEQNTQANAGSFALNLQEGPAQTNTVVQQTIAAPHLTEPDVAEAQIIGNSFNNAVGWIAINQASGQANAQINSFAFSEGHDASIQTALKQTLTDVFGTLAGTPNDSRKAETELGIDGELLADNALQETLSGEQSPFGGEPTRAHRAISVEDMAFQGARGLVQINQSAGSGNSSINNFALRVTVDANN